VSSDRRTVGFDFFAEPELPAPQVTHAWAEQVPADHYGVRGRVQSLGSRQDQNFLVHGEDGGVLGILKTKPPLCIDVESADLYVDALDRVLTSGW
jgi:Ser/Thr protein kinase RdoA (MazF antagonist)